ncbi:hypothetical protein IW147_000098 [Coemansia sp. RSA 720]|nr:hypothetical protein IW147_000098 [Coemansia sp. RSA 720]KAJ2545507.1 hypothetical protein GGF49_000314 [Coemansia sp. RSA 1853]
MPVFQRKHRLKDAIQKAAKDFALFPQVLDVFEKTSNGAQTALDSTLCPLLLQHNASPIEPSSTHTAHANTLLLVLHALVLSFPREMSLVLSTKFNASRVLKLAVCPPADLHVCVVTMVSRWSVVLAQSQAHGLMTSIVDVVYHRTGRVPQVEFLPKICELKEQDGWTYPGPGSAYLYMPKDASGMASNGHASGMASNGHASNHQSGMASNHHASNHQSGSSDAAELTGSTSNSDNILLCNPDPTIQVPTLDLTAMHTCALELRALGTQLTSTLRTMRTTKDPQLDLVVQATTTQLNSTYTALLDHSRMLNSVYNQINGVLQLAADEATQSLAFYNTAIQCHKDWVGHGAMDEGQAGGSNYARAWQASEQDGEMAASALERVSTKARGKMPAE